MQNTSHFKSLYLFFAYLIASGKWQVAAAYPAQMYIDTCVRAKICCRRDYFTMVRKKMKALICDLHHGIMAPGPQEVAKGIIYCILRMRRIVP